MNLTTRSRLAHAVSISAVFVVLLAADSASAEKVMEVIVVENSKTTDDTVRYIAGIEEGDSWDENVREQVRIEMVSSGLFKDVSVFSEPHPKGGVKVTIIAKDKHSWVVAPTIYNQPTNKGAGVGFGENNLFGENKKLLLYGQIATGDSFFIGAYIDPSIRGTRFHWAIDTYLKNERIFEYAPPTKFTDSTKPVRESKMRYLNAGIKVGMSIARSFSIDGRLRGAKVFYRKNPKLVEDALPEDVGIAEGDTVPQPGKEGWDTSAEAILKFDRRANWYGITTGNKYQFSFEKSLPGLGSDFDYWYSTARFERARRYYTFHNFIIKTMLGYGRNIPFQQERTSGGTGLRGYKNAQFRGDVKLSLNSEYSVQLFNIKGFALRGLVFGDVKYTAWLNDERNASEQVRHYLPGSGELGLAPLRTSFGVGTRVYLRQVVLPLLGLDVGYSPESGVYELYFAIGVTDF